VSDQAKQEHIVATSGGDGASANDATRFTEVYTTLLPPVRSYLAKRVDYQVVDDLLADVFAVAWQKRHQVTPGEELPWLFRIASYVVANHRRKATTATKPLSYFTLPDTSPPADAMVSHDPELHKAWAALTPAYREALALVILDDISVNDAAKVLGLTPNTLSIRLHRAKKQLADSLTLITPATTSLNGESGSGSGSGGEREGARGKKTDTDDIRKT
jgi:RNA polymerase sigma-70 factor (ECF subfamily)